MRPLLQLPHLFPGHIEGICDFQTKAIPGIASTESGEAEQAEKAPKQKEENLKAVCIYKPQAAREVMKNCSLEGKSIFHVLLLI